MNGNQTIEVQDTAQGRSFERSDCHTPMVIWLFYLYEGGGGSGGVAAATGGVALERPLFNTSIGSASDIC